MPYNRKRQMEPESDGEQQQVAKKSRGEKKAPKELKTLSQGKDGDGNAYWEIGNNRRIGSSEFKGATLVNIREYYTAPDGQLRPGKKGISLSLDQYKALLKVIPQLNEDLRAQGHEFDDPAAAGTSGALVKAEKPAKAKPQKSNIDATSDEEEGDDEE
ncbi:hypothetical protein N0V88_000892 [Collariella sp. IMI 366227]|nr:hypothetical protein N0V88_000892 [Collariella sp. IMI 366227]